MTPPKITLDPNKLMTLTTYRQLLDAAKYLDNMLERELESIDHRLHGHRKAVQPSQKWRKVE